MDQICPIEKCSGCYACFNICPKQCIELKEDSFGYIYPKINNIDCIDCGLCQKVCPELEKPQLNSPITAYASWSLDSKDRKSSSSGGAASVFARQIIQENGIVFGAAWEENRVHHIKVTQLEQLIKLKGSKYVHSNIHEMYKEAKKELLNNKKVLFIGTPCQIGGLKKYLKKQYDNLITIDIICHGVPSQKLLNEHINKCVSGKIYNYVSFRDCNDFGLRIQKDRSILYETNRKKDLYLRGFLDGLFYRENCYSCQYANSKRVADITVGDYWGIGEEVPFNHDTKNGISLLLPTSDKGINLISKCSANLYIEERPITEAINGNSQLRHPSQRHKNYNRFRYLYLKSDFYTAVNKSLKSDIKIDLLKDSIRQKKFLYRNIRRLLNK